MASGRSNIGAAFQHTRLETIPGHEPFKRVHHPLDGYTPSLECEHTVQAVSPCMSWIAGEKGLS